MEILSRSSEEDEDEYLRREGSSQRGDFIVRFDGKNAEQKQQLLMPRSKHSTMEQRRRSKINDSFLLDDKTRQIFELVQDSINSSRHEVGHNGEKRGEDLKDK
ncbi:uncharacterized protein A4U43_C02F16680 [Asparagus officinalis]|uniref:BHLH domain-containing protein n=1 Tax=Asparagus officinalis TaxID=4686 RepID=A0A5P1FIZ3_ASPOF|nr:uncharacterized protein A4U43_C02F16680 [Asparagus officinalis]